MRVKIQYEKNSTGKSKFIQRLIPALEKLDVKIVNKKPDLTLGLSYWKQKPKGKKIIRVDGIHIEKDKKYDWRRGLIRRAIKQSDGVIFQSKFSYDMLTTILKVHGKKEFIIFNGADPNDYKVEPIESEYPNNVIISGRYATGTVRPHKRLNDMIRIANKFTGVYRDTCFWFCGKTRGELSYNPQIVYTGDLPEFEIRRHLVRADVMLNICYWDWCPNSVVEALVAGVPVICSNQGGVPEIVKNKGRILELDKELIKMKLQKNKPPDIDDFEVIEALDEFLHSDRIGSVKASHLFIDKIAKQYKAAFEDVLK